MRNLVGSLMIGFLVAVTPVYAGGGPGHSHDPITQDAAAGMAAKKLEELVTAGKLDKSWAGVPVKSVEQKSFAKGPEWVVSFTNEASSDPAKRTLYMFYALDGHYLAANFTGK